MYNCFMNYYEELIKNIEDLLNNKKYDEAKSIIDNELNLPYVPKEIEEKLNQYLLIIKDATFALKLLSDEEIEAYLKDNETKQLIAVDELSKRNLRDYIDVIYEYLKDDGYINAKALLIDSLIRQEINYEFEYVNNCSLIKFNPSKLEVIEKTDGFNTAYTLIEENYLKDPSKAHMGIELLYKEALLSLPNQIDGKLISEKIINYIDKAFSAK